MVRQRLDRIIVARGLAPTRSRARDLIVRGCVTVAGSVVTRPGQEVPCDVEVAVAPDAVWYVSRGALKLRAALTHFALDCTGRTALDIGASTGGFTQVLLEQGARKVYAVDVGTGQLATGLACDPRVIALEGTDARRLTGGHIDECVGAIVADVSFISLTRALPVPLTFAAPGAWLVALIKPQFEAGRSAVGKGGIVRDPGDRQRAVEHVTHWLGSQPGWHVAGVIESPLLGGSGNREFLLGACRNG